MDEQTVYRAGLRSLIGANIPHAEVIEASNLSQAINHIRMNTFDLVLAGTGLSSLTALEFLKSAREASPTARFAIISASDTRAEILATLAGGFHGFISKCQSDTEILAAVTSILAGQIYVPASFARKGDDDVLGSRFDRVGSPTFRIAADLSKLTKRQREVLTLLARGLSNKEIARALDIAEATTKIHMAALLRALGARNRTEAAFKAADLRLSDGTDVCQSTSPSKLSMIKAQ
ncbi:MAG: response regulator transcription factor [Xanthobacteraceae bacterium]